MWVVAECSHFLVLECLASVCSGDKSRAKLYDPTTKSFTPACKTALQSVFGRFDADLDGVLRRQEMNRFQLLTDGCDMGPEEYRFLIQYFDNRDGALTMDGFLAAYLYVFQSRGCNEAQLWKELKSLGFNEQLEEVNARTFVVSVHADMTPGATLEEIAFDPELYEDAVELPIIQTGKTTDFADGAIALHSQMSAHGGLSFAVSGGASPRWRCPTVWVYPWCRACAGFKQDRVSGHFHHGAQRRRHERHVPPRQLGG